MASANESPRNKVVSFLLAHAHGGEGAATDPSLVTLDHDLENRFSGPPPAGVKEVVELLAQALRGKAKLRQWVFLVGGPGNGKSWVVREFLGALEGEVTEEPFTSGLARRDYHVKLGEHALQVINDASIPSEDIGEQAGPGSLARDLGAALAPDVEIPTHLLVNVNRGILIEEAARLRRLEGLDREKAVIDWLMYGRVTEGLSHAKCMESPYYRQVTLAARDGEEATSTLHAVFLDQISLLESPPGKHGGAIQGLGGEEVIASQYVVAELGPKDTESRLESPAAKVFSEVVSYRSFEHDSCSNCPSTSHCPFIANARSLRSSQGLSSLLRFLRGAEITSGHLYTYRDLWSLFSLAIVGRREPIWGANLHPCDWVHAKRSHYSPGSDQEDSVSSLLSLASHRTHESLFPCADPDVYLARSTSSGVTPTGVPAAHALASVDPVTDTTPDWSMVVDDALESSKYFDQPLKYLSRKDESGDVSSYIQELDKSVDLELNAVLRASDDLQRRRLLMWRGQSLYRLYALARGIPAQQRLLEQWTRLHSMALRGERAPLRRQPLYVGLERVLFPESGVKPYEDQCLLPVFSARIEPLRGVPKEPTWCYLLEKSGTYGVDWQLVADGDTLRVILTSRVGDQPREIANMQLDHALCRDALVSSHRHGFTSVGSLSDPRLERVRAAFLTDAKPALEGLVFVSSNASDVNFEMP